MTLERILDGLTIALSVVISFVYGIPIAWLFGHWLGIW